MICSSSQHFRVRYLCVFVCLAAALVSAQAALGQDFSWRWRGHRSSRCPLLRRGACRAPRECCPCEAPAATPMICPRTAPLESAECEYLSSPETNRWCPTAVIASFPVPISTTPFCIYETTDCIATGNPIGPPMATLCNFPGVCFCNGNYCDPYSILRHSGGRGTPRFLYDTTVNDQYYEPSAIRDRRKILRSAPGGVAIKPNRDDVLPTTAAGNDDMPMLGRDGYKVRFQKVARIPLSSTSTDFLTVALYRSFDIRENRTGEFDHERDRYFGVAIEYDRDDLDSRNIQEGNGLIEIISLTPRDNVKRLSSGTQHEIAVRVATKAPNDPSRTVRKYYHIYGAVREP